MVPGVVILAEPVSSIIPVIASVARNAESLVGGDGHKSPISPVVVGIFHIGINLTDLHNHICFVGNHILNGRVSVVHLFKQRIESVAGRQ